MGFGLGVQVDQLLADKQDLFVEVIGNVVADQQLVANAATMFCLWVRLDIRSNSSGMRRCSRM